MSTHVEFQRVKAELAALRSRVECLLIEWQVEAADLRRDYVAAGLPSFLASSATIEGCATDLRNQLRRRMNRNDGAVGDARKRAADVPEYPDVLADDVPVPMDWWWTKEGRAQRIADAKAEALRDLRLKCPQHGIPDCSPLLNGCRYPEYLRNQLDEAAR